MEKTYRVPETRLFSYPVPRETRTYKPVSHRQLADITLEAIHDAGFKLGAQEYSSAREGSIANARYTLVDVADDEMQLEIGWQNSYDKTLSLKYAIGTRIFICQNGCVSGNLGSFKKEHRGDIMDFTPLAIVEAIKKSGSTFREIQNQREEMKRVETTRSIQAELLGRMFIEEDIIKTTQLEIIKRELKTPTHDYKCENSLWELYNHTTFAMKELHPTLWMENHIKVHNFFEKCGPVLKSKILHSPEKVIYVDPKQISILDELE